MTGTWRKSGDTKVDLDERKSVLLLRTTGPRLYALDQMLAQLLDAVYGTDADQPRRAFAETRFVGLLESATEGLAKALPAASVSTVPLAFGHREAEVEREVGPGATTSQVLGAGRPASPVKGRGAGSRPRSAHRFP